MHLNSGLPYAFQAAMQLANMETLKLTKLVVYTELHILTSICCNWAPYSSKILYIFILKSTDEWRKKEKCMKGLATAG